MQFVLTIEVPDVDQPHRKIAGLMREAAQTLEMQTVMAEDHQALDTYGEEKYHWTVAEPEAPEPPPEEETGEERRRRIG